MWSRHAVRWSIVAANDYKAFCVRWCFVLTRLLFLDHLFQTIVSREFISSCVCFCAELQHSFIWLISTQFIHEALKKMLPKHFHTCLLWFPFFLSSSIPPVKFKHLTCPLVCVSDWFFFFFLLFCHLPFFQSSVIWQWIKDKTRDGTDLLPGLCCVHLSVPVICSLRVQRRSQASCCRAFYWYTKQTLLTVIRSEPGRHWLVWHQFHICSSLTASWITEIHMKINVLSDVISVLLRCWKSKKPLNTDIRRLHFGDGKNKCFLRWKDDNLYLCFHSIYTNNTY